FLFFFFQAEDGIRYRNVTGVQTCALPIFHADVKYIMVSGQQLKKIRAIKDKLPAVRKIIVLDEQAEYQDREMPLSEIRRMGKVRSEERRVGKEWRWRGWRVD